MILWGMSFVWTTIVFRYYPPIATVFIRLVISFILLYAGILLFRKAEKIKKKDIPMFLASGGLNPFLYFLGESYGLKMTSSTISAVVIATIPLFTPIVAYFTLKEKLTILNIIGMFVSFAGIILMIVNRDMTFNATPSGIGLLLFAVASAVGYSVFFTVATRELGVNKTNVFSNLIPVFTGIFSYFILGELFTLQKILGMMVVVFGLYLSQILKGQPIVYSG
jgi:drug/metabolite transporter (DMT)-like permease